MLHPFFCLCLSFVFSLSFPRFVFSFLFISFHIFSFFLLFLSWCKNIQPVFTFAIFLSFGLSFLSFTCGSHYLVFFFRFSFLSLLVMHSSSSMSSETSNHSFLSFSFFAFSFCLARTYNQWLSLVYYGVVRS